MGGHLWLSLGVIACATLLGIYQSRRLSDRVMFLEESLLMIQKMRAYLSHERVSTARLIQNLTNLDSLQKLTFLADCQERMEKGEIFPLAWKNALESGAGGDPLGGEDRSVLRLIGETLGSATANTQHGELLVVEQLLQQRRADAQKTVQEKGKLYRSLGLLFGIGIAILIF